MAKAAHSTLNSAHKGKPIRKVTDLSFVIDLPKGVRAKRPRCFWNVSPTGDYDADCNTGNSMAIEFIEYQLGDPIRMAVLPWIVEDMPKELSGVEVGFLACIDLAATRGLDYLKRQVAHWERCDAERGAQK